MEPILDRCGDGVGLESGKLINAFFKFNKGILQMPAHWRLWLGLLVLFNGVVPVLCLGRFEAKVVLGVFLVGASLMMILTAAQGFTRLLGLGHIFWFPLLYYVWTRLGQHPGDDYFGWWLRGLMVINGASLVIDVTDVVRYIAGDRKEMIRS